jgi:arabinofuranan 3-O-arabinosyltransferase
MSDGGRDSTRARGQWHAFALTGLAGAVDMAATALPKLKIGRPASSTPGNRRGRLGDRWWFLIVLLLALTVFCATDPGRVIFDTKLGVDINAGEFLHRLWSLWNPQEWFGTIQDQYVGYAIPMAPFFLAGHLLHVPIWLTERLWLALLVTVGFAGLVKLARALEIGSDNSRLLAGAVFALWPTFTILIGSTSAAALPGLVAPWAVLPLVSAVRGRGSPGRAAARSGVAVAAMAGVNAVSTLAVLLLPALYIVSHTKGRQRVGLSLKWSAAVAAATAWWLIPLVLQGRYSFNFLPYIEQAATTTGTMSAAAVLRGTGTWTAYFNLGGIPWLTAGWAVVSSPLAILASAAAAAVGLGGLARRDMPERRWLCGCVGLVAILGLAGYYGPLGGPWHAAIDTLLDGPLAPFRSMYKLEPVIAVALALGCAHAVERCWRLSIPLGRSRRLALAAVSAPVVAIVLAGLALPQLTGQVLQAGSFTGIPGYWYKAAAYLAAHSPRETALVVPANPHGQYTWGDTIDDPLEPLAASPWAERGLVPYGGAGSQVLLDTAEQAIESGKQVPGLPDYLARAGVRYVVIRNDTAPSASSYTPPQVVNETLVQSGFRRVASFGPQIPAAPGYPNVAGLTPGFALSYPAIEIFEASSPTARVASPVAALPVSTTVLVNGGPDSLLQLAGQGVLTSQAVAISGQKLAGPPSLWAVTDGQRRVDNEFGATANYQSFTYTADEPNPVDDPLGGAAGPPRQLLPVPAAGHVTVAVLSGAASVAASSDGTWLGESPQYDPVNAFDGNPATAWAESSPVTPVGQWIQIDFGRTIDLPSRVGIQLLDSYYGQAIPNQLRVTTSAGVASTDTVSTADVQPLQVPAGPSSWLRVTITGANNVVPGEAGAGISDVLIPGVHVTRFLKPAEDAAGTRAAAVVFSFSQQVSSSYNQDSQDNLNPASTQQLDRVFDMPAAATMSARITAVPDPGPALEDLISQLSPRSKSRFQVTASSIWAGLPEFGPDNLFRPGAGRPWLSGANDPHPWLELTWQGRRTIRKIVLKPALGLATPPTGVLIGSPSGDRLVSVGLGGVVPVSPPLRTDKLYLTFSAASSSAAGVAAYGQPAQLPIGLASVGVPRLAGLHVAAPNATTRFQLSCGSGPAISVNGHAYQTSVSGTLGDLIQLQPVKLGLCTPGGGLALAAGKQALAARPSGDFTITDLSLRSQPGSGAPASAGQSRRLQVRTWQADNRVLAIGPGPASYVEIHENANPGWIATMDGRRLTAATLDGWQQAFVVPAGQGGVITLTYAPTSVYHAGIIGSGIALLILLGLAIGAGGLRRRRSGLLAGNRLGPAQPAVTPAAQGRAEHPAPVSWRAALVSAVPPAVVILATGGPIAIAIPVLAVISNWRARWLPLIAAGAMFAAGVVVAAARVPNAIGSGAFSGPAQVCALVALAAALMPAISAGRSRALPSAPAPGEPAGAMQRRPFTVPDEMACYFDTQAEPFNIHLEIRVPGRLDRQVFQTAAVAALVANPHASSRRAPHKLLTSGYVWEHPATLDREPVSFIDLADEADVARLRAAFISRSPSVDASPPASLLVASAPDCDYVIVNGHHAAMDALSWLDLLRDIGRRYRTAAGSALAVPAPSTSPAYAPPDDVRASAPSATRLAGPAPATHRWRTAARPARIARDGEGQRGYGLHLLLLPHVPAVTPFSNGDKATLNDALTTALIAAVGRWNAAHGRSARLVRITTPFNARNPGDLTAAGNLSRLVTISAAPPAAEADLMPLLRDVASQARIARQRGGPQVGAGTRLLGSLRCPAVVKRLAVQAALRTAGPLVCDSALLTNLGNVPDPPDFGIEGHMTMAFSAQAQMPRGLSVAAITVGGQLQLALRHSRALFDEAAAERFGTTLLDALGEITTSRDSDDGRYGADEEM